MPPAVASTFESTDHARATIPCPRLIAVPALRASLLAAFGASLASSSIAWAEDPPTVHAIRAKSSLGVAIDYTLSAPAIGQPSTLTLTASSSAEPGSVSMTLRPDAGLALSSPDLSIGEAQPLQASQTFRLTVTPTREGLSYVHVFLRAGARGRALAIAVPVGNAKTGLNKDLHVLSVPGGGRVISVPSRQ